MNVLVIDDDPEIRQLVRRALEREHMQVLEAHDGDEALRLIQEVAVDVALLDLHLPGISGLEVLDQLRTHQPDIHVIMVTGASSEADRVLGLVSGADDYVVKPFSARELAARVGAVRRRREATASTVLEFGDLHIDTASRIVTLAGNVVSLTPREFALLLHLAAHPVRSYTRAELLEAVWDSSAEWQSETTVTEHVRRLRHKIEVDPNHPVRIVTVKGHGYRFDPDGNPASTEATGPGADLDATAVLVDGAIVDASPALIELIGATDRTEVVGRPLLDFVAPQSIGTAQAREEITRQGRSPRPEVITIQRLDGAEVLTEVSTVQVSWEGRAATRLSLWDLTGDSMKLQELVTGIRTEVSDAIMITDAQLRIVSFNPAAEALYGWSEEHVLGKSIHHVVPWRRNAAVFDAATQAVLRDGRWHGETEQDRADGSSVIVRTSVTLLRDRAGEPVGLVCVNRPVLESNGADTPTSWMGDDLQRAVHDGIERREFVVHYQPIVSLGDGSWAGVEALVRWEHPQRGLLGPVEFIDAAERSGSIVELGEYVLDVACGQVASLRAAGHDLYVSVNLSGRQLADPQLFDRITRSLSSCDLPPEKLWLEVTETSLVNDLEQAAAVLHRITATGPRVAIDDFGTGWASLTYLREFPVHSLKIDRSFVEGIGTSAAGVAIVNSIISLGRELELQVVAEGIETRDQHEHLVELGCMLGQGYLFARPARLESLSPGSRLP